MGLMSEIYRTLFELWI